MKIKNSSEINVPGSLIDNKKIYVSVGTVDKKESPDTVYISVSFWTRPDEEFLKSDGFEVRDILKKEINTLYRKLISDFLKENNLFVKKEDSFLINSIPDNFNYNEKRNYVNFEIYLHTSNIFSKTKLPLSQKKNENTLYNECVKIINFFGDSELLREQKGFLIFDSNK